MSFRRTFVGLKLRSTTSLAVLAAGFRRTFVGLKHFQIRLDARAQRVSDEPSWG